MNPTRFRRLAALIAPTVMVIAGGIIGLYADGDRSGAPIKTPAEQLSCREPDEYPDTFRTEVDSTGQGALATRAHEEELNALPKYPGCVRGSDIVANGNGTFASYSVSAEPSEVASYYGDQLPGLGWQAATAPTKLPTKDATQLPQTLVTFLKDEYLLSIYLDPNGAKGGERGSLNVTFRLQDR